MTEEKGNLLLQPVPVGGDWQGNAIIGGSREDDGAMAAGFLEAGDILVEHWKSRGPNDLLALPIFANYRHGIELALKDAIRDAAACVWRDGVLDPRLHPDELDRRLAGTHAIGALVDELNGCLGRLQVGSENQQLDPDTLEVLDSLHALDEKGQAFRYSTVKTGKGKHVKLVQARPDHQHVDLVTTATALHDACVLVLYGVTGLLDEYREYQQAMGEVRRTEP